jgi:hypothetical protein
MRLLTGGGNGCSTETFRVSNGYAGDKCRLTASREAAWSSTCPPATGSPSLSLYTCVYELRANISPINNSRFDTVPATRFYPVSCILDRTPRASAAITEHTVLRETGVNVIAGPIPKGPPVI